MSRTSHCPAVGWGAFLALLPLVLACSAEIQAPESAAERGQALFESGALSDSSLNVYACSTCHEAQPTGSSQIFPGAGLAGATERPSFWGGQENDLLRSLDACRSCFMFASEPLDPASAEASELYAYLVSLGPGNPEPVPFSVVMVIEPLPRGDAVRGGELFANACAACHGSMHEGRGALQRVPVLPEETLLEHEDYTPEEQRLVFIEKSRHGAFLGYGGSMAPFSLETLGDAELSDILEALGVLGE